MARESGRQHLTGGPGGKFAAENLCEPAPVKCIIDRATSTHLVERRPVHIQR